MGYPDGYRLFNYSLIGILLLKKNDKDIDQKDVFKQMFKIVDTNQDQQLSESEITTFFEFLFKFMMLGFDFDEDDLKEIEKNQEEDDDSSPAALAKEMMKLMNKGPGETLKLDEFINAFLSDEQFDGLNPFSK